MISVTKIFTFDAAHCLPFHKGKCKEVHGHTYKLEVTVTGPMDENEILIDFSDLKSIVNEQIVDKYDHKMLNDFFTYPTAEHMVGIFASVLCCHFAEKEMDVIRIKLWETPTSFAEWTNASL